MFKNLARKLKRYSPAPVKIENFHVENRCVLALDPNTFFDQTRKWKKTKP
jgi:hypothetical protein